jgi:hypothetical protein
MGCDRGSGSKVHVTGHVTLDGKPLDAGSITFTGVEGKHAQAGGQILKGQYAVDNVTPGKTKIIVQGGLASTEGAGSGGGGGADAAYARHMQRENKMRQMEGIGRENPRQAMKMAQEMRASSAAVTDKTMGNNQVQDISTERNQTIDINLQTVKTKGGF